MDNRKAMAQRTVMCLYSVDVADEHAGDYLPPRIEVVRVAVERGFAASDGGMTLPDWDII